MAITVPADDQSHALALQNHITVLAARSDAYSQNLADQKRRDLVHTLLDQKKTTAAAILAAVAGTYPTSKFANAAKVTALTAQAAAFTAQGGNNLTIAVSPGGLNNQLEAAQRSLVSELMESGVVSPATILAHPSLSYVGGSVKH